MLKDRSVFMKTNEHTKKKSKDEASIKEKKREKSLAQLCTQFIDLFITKSSELSLEQAGEMLTNLPIADYDKIKTKIRRLYDIANVLQALNILEKITMSNNKPGFHWLGYKGFLTCLELQQKKNSNILFNCIDNENIKQDEEFSVSHEEKSISHSVSEAPKLKRFTPKILQISSPYVHKISKKENHSVTFKPQVLEFNQKVEYEKEVDEIPSNLNILVKVTGGG